MYKKERYTILCERLAGKMDFPTASGDQRLLFRTPFSPHSFTSLPSRTNINHRKGSQRLRRLATHSPTSPPSAALFPVQSFLISPGFLSIYLRIYSRMFTMSLPDAFAGFVEVVAVVVEDPADEMKFAVALSHSVKQV